MPIYDNSSKTFTVDDLGGPNCITMLVRGLDIKHWCEYFRFMAVIDSNADPYDNFNVVVRFWVPEEGNSSHALFEFFSDLIPVVGGSRDNVIDFSAYVLSPYDYFYVTLLIFMDEGLTSVSFDLKNCCLISPSSSLLLTNPDGVHTQSQGWLLNDLSTYNVGVLYRVFKDALRHRHIYGEVLTVDTGIPHFASLSLLSDQNPVHTVVYANGVPLIYTTDWSFSQKLTLLAAGYTHAFNSDIGRMVTADGLDIGLLTAYDNATFTWHVNSTTVINSGASISITGGTGAGVAESGSLSEITIVDGSYDGVVAYSIDYLGLSMFIHFSDKKIIEAEDIIPIHCPVERREGYYCNNLIAGNSRYCDENGNVLEIVGVDAWGTFARDVAEVEVDFYSSDKLDCAFNGSSLSLTYTINGITTFTYGDSVNGGEARIFCGFDSSASPISIIAIYAKKYFGGALQSSSNFEQIARTNFPFWAPSCNQAVEQTLSFAFAGPDWRAVLDHPGDEDETHAVLLKDGVPVPDSEIWTFINDSTIELIDAEYDSSSAFILRYNAKIEMVFETDLSSLTGFDNIYMTPLADMFLAGAPIEREINTTETVKFSAQGVGRLKHISNGVIGNATVVRQMVGSQLTLPNSAVKSLRDDSITIDPKYYSENAYYSVNYKAIIPEIEDYADYLIQWSYFDGSVWTAYRDWDGRELLPKKFFANGGLNTINLYRLKLVFSNVQDYNMLVVRGAGLFLLSPYEWEI